MGGGENLPEVWSSFISTYFSMLSDSILIGNLEPAVGDGGESA